MEWYVISDSSKGSHDKKQYIIHNAQSNKLISDTIWYYPIGSEPNHECQLWILNN